MNHFILDCAEEVSLWSRTHLSDATHIRSCVSYISSIVNSTLDLSKLESKKLNFTVEKIFLKTGVLLPCIQQLSEMRPDLVEVRLHCEESFMVIADPMRLKHVVLNLITNAYKSTSSGSINITARIATPRGRTTSRLQTHPPLPKQQRQGGGGSPKGRMGQSSVVIIEVKDTGLVVPPEQRSKLFSKYGQLSVRQGAGLGLCLSQRLMGAMQGRLYLDETYTAGSSFVIEIPGELASNASASSTSMAALEENRPPFLASTAQTVTMSTNNSFSNNSSSNSNSTFRDGGEGETVNHFFCLANLQIALVAPINCSVIQQTINAYLKAHSQAVLPHYSVFSTLRPALLESKQRPFDVVFIEHNPLMFTASDICDFTTTLRSTASSASSAVLLYSEEEDSISKTVREDNGNNTLLGVDDCLDLSDFSSATQKIIESISRSREAHTSRMASKLPGNVSLLLIDDSVSVAKVLLKRLARSCPISWKFEHMTYPDKFLAQLQEEGEVEGKEGADESPERLLGKYNVVITDENFGASHTIRGLDVVKALRSKGFRGVLIGCSGDDMTAEHLKAGADFSWPKPPPANDMILQQFASLAQKLV